MAGDQDYDEAGHVGVKMKPVPHEKPHRMNAGFSLRSPWETSSSQTTLARSA